MKQFKYIYTLIAFAIISAISLGHDVQASNPFYMENECAAKVATGDAIIVHFAYGTVRFGLQSAASPTKIKMTVRESSSDFKNDFSALMNQVYSSLNITNKANHPVLVIEPDQFNSWRRVDMADVIMGTHGAPWMYVMFHSIITVYGNNDGTSSGLVYFADDNHTAITPVCGGMENFYGHRDFNFYEQKVKAVADSLFWSIMDADYYSRADVFGNIILTGDQWKNVTNAQKTEIQNRIIAQRYSTSHVPNVITLADHENAGFQAGKKICNDGILLGSNLAFTQSHYTSKGAGYIRQWIY